MWDIFYSGKLAKGKTIDDLISYVEVLAKEKGFMTAKPADFHDRGIHSFRIPIEVVEKPDESYWMCPNRERIIEYCKDAKIPIEGRSHSELCQALNSAEFRQVGIYLWAQGQEYAEPLRFIFVEGNNELTELATDILRRDRCSEGIQYVHFQRDSLATKLDTEADHSALPRAHDLLSKISGLFFGGKMQIYVPG